jgi:hypothetical protein
MTVFTFPMRSSIAASLQHYLVADLKRRLVLHHRRGEGTAIPTEIVREGSLMLDPPGLTLALSDIFGDRHLDAQPA